ncbi:MAG: hypothetical protein ACRERD_08555 [Candidatus Binatia bacterium]
MKADLTQYLDQARAWVATEEQINTAIAKAQADQFVHEDMVTGALRPAIGMAQEHVQTLEQYQPRTPRLSSLHQQYIKAWRTYSPAMTAVVEAMEKKDYIRLAIAKDELTIAQNTVGMALNDLAGLMEETGLRAKPAPPETGSAEEESSGMSGGQGMQSQPEPPVHEPSEP